MDDREKDKMTVYIQLTRTKTSGARSIAGTYEDSPTGRELADKAAFQTLARPDVVSIAAIRVTRRSGQR